MIVHVLRLTRWEWFKLRHRWMPWILLGIVALVVQITLPGLLHFVPVHGLRQRIPPRFFSLRA